MQNVMEKLVPDLFIKNQKGIYLDQLPEMQ